MSEEKLNLKNQNLAHIGNYVEKIVTWNQSEIYFNFNASAELKKQWANRISCSSCFLNKYLKKEDIDISEIPYLVSLYTSFSEVKSLLFEKSNGNFHLQPNASSAVLNGVLFAQQKTSPFMDVHEYVHIVMGNLRNIHKKSTVTDKFDFLPMWFNEGLPQYIQGQKDGSDFIKKARKMEYIPPFLVQEMNIPTKKFWLEFGTMEQYMVTGAHPGLFGCASFVQFLIEKEKIGLKQVWELMFERNINVFYQKIEMLCGKKLFDVANNYLYYIDKPRLDKGTDFWKMPVVSGTDFRGEFIYEEKTFPLIKFS